MSRQEIDGFSLDDLYVELALQWPVFLPNGVMTAPPTIWLLRWIERQVARIGLYRKRKIQSGRKLFSSIEHEIHAKLCDDWKACEKLKLEKKYSDETQLAQAVAGVIETIMVGLPVVVVTSLIMKIGVRHFCNCAEISS